MMCAAPNLVLPGSGEGTVIMPGFHGVQVKQESTGNVDMPATRARKLCYHCHYTRTL